MKLKLSQIHQGSPRTGMFTCGPIRQLVLLGSFPRFDILLRGGRKFGLDVKIVTSPDQREEFRVSDRRAVLVTKDIDSAEVSRFLRRTGVNKTHSRRETVAISFGARWIIRRETSDRLFDGNLLNVHGARLPLDRGGGGISWRIMRGDRIGVLLIHKIDDGVDTGPVLDTEDYVIPAKLRKPGEIMVDHFDRVAGFVTRFVGRIAKRKCQFVLRPQPNYLSSYNPRLHTPTHAWINWNWEPHHIESFIQAFDDPYLGARTLWRGNICLLKDCQLHTGETGRHPFQTGLVVRNNGLWLVVALAGEYSLIVETLRDENGTNMIPHIKEGDRFHTSPSLLEKALATRSAFGPMGVVTPKSNK